MSIDQKSIDGKIVGDRVWALDDRQEIALKKMWAVLLKSFGYEINISLLAIHLGAGLVSSVRPAPGNASLALSRSSRKEYDSASVSASLASFDYQLSNSKIKSTFYSLETGTYDADSGSDVFSVCGSVTHPTLREYIPEDLHKSLWASCRNDFVDNFMLRFLHASDFEYKPAVKMVAECLDFRINKHGVEDILSKGDSHYYFEGKNPKLVQTFMKNEVYLRGRTRSGCPIIFIRAKRHLRSNCPDADYETFIILMFEWARLTLSEYKGGVSSSHIFFDLTGFTLKNADFHAVKFFVHMCQKRFPYCASVIYIHNAPKVFSVMWNIVLRWLKPELRDRLIFTSSYEQIHKHISSRYIPKSLGGRDKNVPPYIEPNLYNCQRKMPDDRFSALVRERDGLTVKFIESTIRWIEAPSHRESKIHLDNKIRISKAKAKNYIELDPYLRTRGIPDRNGEIGQLSY